jgi:Holliday junction resolvase-like predicted endonuclease
MVTTEDLAQAILELKNSTLRLESSQEKISFELKESTLRLESSQESLSAEVKKQAKYIGNIGRNQGDVAEEFFINSISPTLKVGEIQYDELHKNWHKKTKKVEGEFDIVLINGKDLAIIETKYKAHENDLDDLINKKHTNFKKLYPQYDNYTHHLGLASFYINDDTKEKALKNNVMILQRKGELIETILPLS